MSSKMDSFTKLSFSQKQHFFSLKMNNSPEATYQMAKNVVFR